MQQAHWGQLLLLLLVVVVVMVRAAWHDLKHDSGLSLRAIAEEYGQARPRVSLMFAKVAREKVHAENHQRSA